jgi:hypothetical protein
MDKNHLTIAAIVAGICILLLLAFKSRTTLTLEAAEDHPKLSPGMSPKSAGLPTLNMGLYQISPHYYYNLTKLGNKFPLSTANAQASEAGVVPCGCTGTLNSVYQSSYDELIDGFNANLKNLADNYTSGMLAGMPTYFTQYINNAAGALASGNFQEAYNAIS